MTSSTKTKNHGYVTAVGVAVEAGRVYTSIGTGIACTTAIQYTSVIDIREESTAVLYIEVSLNSGTYVEISFEFSNASGGTYYKQTLLDTFSSSPHTLSPMTIRIDADGLYSWALPVADNYMKIGYASDSATATIDSLAITTSAQPTAWHIKSA